MLRLGGEDREALLGLGGEVFAPMAGRPMKDYVVVPGPMISDTDAMGLWVERALAHAAALPPKKPKAAKAPGPARVVLAADFSGTEVSRPGGSG